MKIREMIRSDLEPLREIYLECRKKTFHWMPLESFSLCDFEEDTEGEWVLVAEERSRILGFSSVWTYDNFLHHLYIRPSDQGRGIGKLLLASCLSQKLCKPARLKCIVKNTKACEFYESLGWIIESTTENSPMGPYHTYLLAR
jgi:ribosomal protein S18 acetylase RimI-like enzyme